MLKLLQFFGLLETPAERKIEDALKIFDTAKIKVKEAKESVDEEVDSLVREIDFLEEQRTKVYNEFTMEIKKTEQDQNRLLNKNDKLNRIEAKLEEFTV